MQNGSKWLKMAQNGSTWLHSLQARATHLSGRATSNSLLSFPGPRSPVPAPWGLALRCRVEGFCGSFLFPGTQDGTANHSGFDRRRGGQVLSFESGKPACRWRGLSLLFKLAFSAGEAELFSEPLISELCMQNSFACHWQPLAAIGSSQDGVRFDTIRLIINKIYCGPQAAMRNLARQHRVGSVRLAAPSPFRSRAQRLRGMKEKHEDWLKSNELYKLYYIYI